jgi:hypothetical protein
MTNFLKAVMRKHLKLLNSKQDPKKKRSELLASFIQCIWEIICSLNDTNQMVFILLSWQEFRNVYCQQAHRKLKKKCIIISMYSKNFVWNIIWIHWALNTIFLKFNFIPIWQAWTAIIILSLNFIKKPQYQILSQILTQTSLFFRVKIMFH